MRIVIDANTCAGHGECEEVAPEVFSVGTDGIARVLIADPPPDLRLKIEKAVRMCPQSAITVVE